MSSLMSNREDEKLVHYARKIIMLEQGVHASPETWASNAVARTFELLSRSSCSNGDDESALTSENSALIGLVNIREPQSRR